MNKYASSLIILITFCFLKSKFIDLLTIKNQVKISKKKKERKVILKPCVCFLEFV